MASIKQICIAAASGDTALPVGEARLEKDKGIVGDRYHAAASEALAAGKPAPENQVTLIASEVLDDFITSEGADLHYGDFRRSIITEGVDLNALVGQEFWLGEVRCQGVELCEPCRWLAENVHPRVLPVLVHKGGIRARVLGSGTISPGTPIRTG